MIDNFKVQFFNFPHDFDANSNFFLDLVRSISSCVEIDFPIHFYGCYPEISTAKKGLLYLNSRKNDHGMLNWLNLRQGLVKPIDLSAFNVWCTYENRRPPSGDFDLTFSFDLDSYGGKNHYLPLIYLYLNHEIGNPMYSKHSIRPSELLIRREVKEKSIQIKKKFMSSFINNPHPLRLRAVKEFSVFNDVDVYGRSTGNYVTDKIEVARKYWFNLCFENDLYPGYVTEKILESWLAESIPVYWGDDKKRILNPNAFINLTDYESLDDFVFEVKKIYSDRDRMQEMLEQPLLRTAFDFAAVQEFLFRGIRSRVVK